MPERKRKEKPDVSIIGLGRLGTTLARALSRKDYQIRSLVGRHKPDEIRSLSPSDLILITTPDDQIAKVAAELSGLDWTATALHTSGALSSEVLTAMRSRGWSTGSVHPLISVSEPRTAIDGAFWCVEGDGRALRVARALVRDLEGQSFSIRAAEKPLYHAAAVMASGNVVALFDVALEMLVAAGLTRKNARSILQPLLASTVENLETKDPAQALTGTFSRGDVETVKRHLAALKQHKLPAALELYCRLGNRSVKLTKKQSRITDILREC
jgi:predicted short-subunit dehydrogenase-like oxidoreductase (DUF2520 family)